MLTGKERVSAGQLERLIATPTRVATEAIKLKSLLTLCKFHPLG